MRYSLNVIWSVVLAASVLSLCDAPIVVSFDSSLISSPFEQALQHTMHVWSDVREAATIPNNQLSDEYTMLIHAIIGQLVCIEHALRACDVAVISDDSAYLAHVLVMVKQEALALFLTQIHKSSMQRLFDTIENLCQTDDTTIGSR